MADAILPMPDEKHQAIVFFLVHALKQFASASGGRATMAPFPMRTREEKYREPNVLYMKEENLAQLVVTRGIGTEPIL